MRARIPIGAALPMAERPSWFRALVRASDAVACAAPRAGLRLASAAGVLCHAARWWGAETGEVRELFPWLGRREAGRLARSVTAQHLKCRAFDRLLRSDRAEAAARLLSRPHLARLDEALGAGGLVLLDVHTGPISATSLALHATGRSAMILRMSEPGAHLAGLEVASLDADEQRRAQVLRRALGCLQSGRPLVLAADGGVGAACQPVPCCGRLVRFRRGAFALARISGAPIVPLFFRWGAGDRIEVEAEPAMHVRALGDPAAEETEMAGRVAALLERRLRARPSDLSLSLLRWMLSAQDIAQG